MQYVPHTIAEVYIYRDSNGVRMISDWPMRGYQLINKRDSLENVGHILADRSISTDGPENFNPICEWQVTVLALTLRWLRQ